MAFLNAVNFPPRICSQYVGMAHLHLLLSLEVYLVLTVEEGLMIVILVLAYIFDAIRHLDAYPNLHF